jgi:glycosyltransferase involved in cell wall biosynthesis
MAHVTHCAFAIPGDIASPTGGYAYDRQLIKRLPEHGVEVSHLALAGSFPSASEADLTEASRLLLAEDWRTVLLIDGLAYGAFPTGMAAGLAGRVVALCHHPLALETGLSPERAAELKRLETAALGYAAAVIVTGRGTKDILVNDFGVPAGKITVAEPGVERASRAAETPFGQPLQLLAVGAISARKGYDLLLSALAPIAGLPWRLTIAGKVLDAGVMAALQAQTAVLGLSDRIRFAGPVSAEELDTLYRGSDLFVMASHYEGYGMVLTEALARGLPIVTTRSGPAVEALPDAAVQKCAVGDAGDLTGSIAYLMGDTSARRRHADAAWAAAARLPGWDDTARIAATVIKSVTP